MFFVFRVLCNYKYNWVCKFDEEISKYVVFRVVGRMMRCYYRVREGIEGLYLFGFLEKIKRKVIIEYFCFVFF